MRTCKTLITFIFVVLVTACGFDLDSLQSEPDKQRESSNPGSEKFEETPQEIGNDEGTNPDSDGFSDEWDIYYELLYLSPEEAIDLYAEDLGKIIEIAAFELGRYDAIRASLLNSQKRIKDLCSWDSELHAKIRDSLTSVIDNPDLPKQERHKKAKEILATYSQLLLDDRSQLTECIEAKRDGVAKEYKFFRSVSDGCLHSVDKLYPHDDMINITKSSDNDLLPDSVNKIRSLSQAKKTVTMTMEALEKLHVKLNGDVCRNLVPVKNINNIIQDKGPSDLCERLRQRLCTAEYKPAQCTYKDLSAKGSNKCVAAVNLQNVLCKEKNFPLEIDDIEEYCFFLEQPDVCLDDKQRTKCTKEFHPTYCALGYDFRTKGDNKCLAVAEMKYQLCLDGERDWGGTEADLECKPIDPVRNPCDELDSYAVSCTEQYEPAYCVIDDWKTEGGNRCDAATKMQQTICETADKFVEISEIEPLCNLVTKPCSAYKTQACTKEYNPTYCKVSGLEAKGSNSCTAINEMEYLLCASYKDVPDRKTIAANCSPLKDNPKSDCDKLNEYVIDCSRDKSPTVCEFDEFGVKGYNKCEAVKSLQRLICDKADIYVEWDDLSSYCEPELATNCNKYRLKQCTFEYRPAHCSLLGLESKGINQCNAVNEMQYLLCSKKEKMIEREDIGKSCKPTNPIY